MTGMSMILTDDHPPDISGSVEMKTKLGWSVRWCEFTGKTCQFIRSHDREDRTTRKLSDLKQAKLKLEPGHSSDRYIEVMHARSQEAGVHTLRLRLASAREATVWIQTVQKAQNHQLRKEQLRKVYVVKKNADGTVGLKLRKSIIESVDPKGPASNAGLVAGLQIIRVGDTLVRQEDEGHTAMYVRNAPGKFEIEVRTPKEAEKVENFANEHTIARVKTLAMYWKRRTGEYLPETILRELIPWINHNLKIMVVLWGWGNTVESRHISVPGAFVNAKTVHSHLDADQSWHTARECDSSWDSKAVYFAGPSAGPTAGRQRRVLPSEPLSNAGFNEGKGLALHVVSVDSKKHLADFSSSAEEKGDGGKGKKHMPIAEHNKIVAKKNEEIARLKAKIVELQKALKQSGLPWEEEEPSVVADLKDKVDAATTLDELESLDLPEEEAGFFTPTGTPVNSDHWRGVDEAMMGRASPLDLDDQLSVCSAEEWVGPEDGPRAGHGIVELRPRGPIEDLPPNSASEGWAEGWNLRNVGYKRTGEKVPSLDSLYALSGVDLYKSQFAIKHVAEQLRVPTVNFDTQGLPPNVIFNLQLPFCEAPSVWGQADGPAANVIVTFTLKKSAVDEMASTPPAQLLKEFCSKIPITDKGVAASSDPFLGRFKFLVRAEKGVPKAFSRYNGKPVLVTRSGTYYKTDNYLQVDCNLRSWAYTARVALYSLWGAIPQFKLHVGCCIEARDDAESPERILGCAQISNLQLDDAPDWPGECGPAQ
eukprot:TRINITY_DN2624_c0_g1_i2.p1 TRINITY_DN2624_c0_g1~~TRINITY_DN2624_c0_g1_i2.p1  ORF type:complete len:782 (+),score=109.37 TRINITY_DN2624_c0_g1_i2:61-2346(+)